MAKKRIKFLSDIETTGVTVVGKTATVGLEVTGDTSVNSISLLETELTKDEIVQLKLMANYNLAEGEF